MPINPTLEALIEANLPDNTTGDIAPADLREVELAIATEIADGDKSADTIIDGTNNKAFTAAEKTKLGNVPADTNTALAAKQATLVSGTNIKTINGQSLLGSGNITISGGGSSGPYPEITGTIIEEGKGYKTLTGNTAMTVDPDLYDFIVYFFQNGTGGHTLSIEGEALTIDADPDAATCVTGSYVNGSWLFSITTGLVVAGGLTQLATPTLTANAVSDDQIDLSWTNVSNESSYKLEWSANGTTGWTQIGGTIAANTTTYNHTGLTASTQYFYRITAVGDGITYSDSGYGTDDDTTDAAGTTPLSTPTLTASTISASQIDLSWTNVANESSYKLEWSPNGTSGWTQIGGTIAANTTTYSHTGLTASTQYFYRITAVGDGVTWADSGYGTDDATTSAGAAYLTWRNIAKMGTANNGIARNATEVTPYDASAVAVQTFIVGDSVEFRFTPGLTGDVYVGYTNSNSSMGNVIAGVGVNLVPSPGSSSISKWADGSSGGTFTGLTAFDVSDCTFKLTMITGDIELFVKNSSTAGAFVSVGSGTTAPASMSGVDDFGLVVGTAVGLGIEDALKS